MDTSETIPTKGPNAIASLGLSRRRLTINSAATVSNYVLLMVIGLWYTPYMLHRIPESVYGLVSLATSLTNYLVIVMSMISGPVGRYVTADLSRGDIAGANATFNSFFFGGAKIVSVLVVVVLAFCMFLPINVPAGYEGRARLLFGSIGISLLVSSYSNCFDTAYWATNRFEIRSMLDIAALLLRNGVVVVLFLFTTPDIWQISVAVIVTTVFQFVMVYNVWKRLTPELHIDRKAQTPERRKLIYSIGRWLMGSYVGNQLLMSSDLFLINRYFGSADNAKYGVLLLWASIVRSVFSSIGLILQPSLVALEATESAQNMVAVTSRAIRAIGTLAAHATGVLAGLALPLLTIWIKKPWVSEVAPLTAIILLPLCFELSSIPLTSLLIAEERIRKTAIFSIATGFSSVVVSLILLNTTHLGFYAVALPIAACSMLRYGLCYNILATQGLHDKWYRFVGMEIPMTIRFFATAAVAYGLGYWLQPTSIYAILTCFVLTAIIVLPLSFLALPKSDRQMMGHFLRPKVA